MKIAQRYILLDRINIFNSPYTKISNTKRWNEPTKQDWFVGGFDNYFIVG